MLSTVGNGSGLLAQPIGFRTSDVVSQSGPTSGIIAGRYTLSRSYRLVGLARTASTASVRASAGAAGLARLSPRLAGFLKGRLARNWLVGAVAVMVDTDVVPPEILLVEHSYRRRGTWGLPGGSLESIPGDPSAPRAELLRRRYRGHATPRGSGRARHRYRRDPAPARRCRALRGRGAGSVPARLLLPLPARGRLRVASCGVRRRPVPAALAGDRAGSAGAPRCRATV